MCNFYSTLILAIIKNMNLKIMTLTILSTLLIFACQITNPITITQQWLTLSSQSQFDASLAMMVDIQDNQIMPLSVDKQQAFRDYFTQAYPQLNMIDVNNMVPMQKTELETLGIDQGYTVFYSLISEKSGQQDLQVKVIWWENQWRVVYKVPFS